MKGLIAGSIRFGSVVYAAGWLIWFLARDQAMRGCFPGQAVVAPYPGDPGSLCQQFVEQIPYFLIAIAILLELAIAVGRQVRSNRRRP